MSLSLGYLVTGHGSMNAYLYERKLWVTGKCDCGNDTEDWKHVLCECGYYVDLRDLPSFGITVVDEMVNVSDVLMCKNHYDRVNEYAMNVFKEGRSA